jgi:ABC-type oligopeptide transport system substrate-binding subunit
MKHYLLIALLLLLAACGDIYNNPHPPESGAQVIHYSNFQIAPKHLDPALSYASDESLIIDQIYEPPLGYHFLKRPYELMPLAAAEMPEIIFLDENLQATDAEAGNVAYSRYIIRINPASHYQPHPAFAKDQQGKPLYLFKTAQASAHYRKLEDFPLLDSRPVHANDFIYQIKRLADPKNKSPMLGFMSQYIVGMTEFSAQLAAIERNGWLNLHDHPMQGLELIDNHTFSILIKGRYPQFSYWLAMHFFAPIPPEADRFYHNPGFKAKNLTLDWYPVGSGPFMMTRNDPNSSIVLERNPNFHPDYYPDEGEASDRDIGLLNDAGKQLPLIDKAVYSLERSGLSLWTKFMQGYYDRSGDNHANTMAVFDQAFVIGPNGLELSEEMQDHQLTVAKDVKPAVFYFGFNMRDPVVGGYSEQARKLRQALSIAYNEQDFIDIFMNGGAISSQGPIPPGIPGHLTGKAGINPYIYDWVDGEPQRKSLEYARQLLTEAGYPNGRDAKTGKPLKIFFDVQSQATSNSSMEWQRRQFEALGIQLEYRPTDWNRFREKLLTGNVQLFSHGWLADYPDPENFLFLLYGPESPLTCQCDGANNANYENANYDALFRKMRTMQAGPERDQIVAEMVDIVRRDAVWMSGYHPLEYYLNNQWTYNTKRHGISKNTLKYLRIDTKLRAEKQREWNQPVRWPLLLIIAVVVLLLLPAISAYRRRQNLTINP